MEWAEPLVLNDIILPLTAIQASLTSQLYAADAAHMQFPSLRLLSSIFSGLLKPAASVPPISA